MVLNTTQKQEINYEMEYNKSTDFVADAVVTTIKLNKATIALLDKFALPEAHEKGLVELSDLISGCSKQRRRVKKVLTDRIESRALVFFANDLLKHGEVKFTEDVNASSLQSYFDNLIRVATDLAQPIHSKVTIKSTQDVSSDE